MTSGPALIKALNHVAALLLPSRQLARMRNLSEVWRGGLSGHFAKYLRGRLVAE
jgi:hypothetical protein